MKVGREEVMVRGEMEGGIEEGEKGWRDGLCVRWNRKEELKCYVD